MSTWSTWLFSGTKEEPVDTDKKEGDKKQEGDNKQEGDSKQQEEEEEEDGWTKGIEIANSWMQSVTSYASNLTDNVKKQVTESTTTGFLGDFQKEQDKFERKQRHGKDSGVPPWVGYNEEEVIKIQVLELSADSRNFLREPPHGVNFPFDYEKVSPVAMVMIQEDPRLQKLRFELVPKKVSEKSFWRNYFYRISLIKQSVQLSTLSAAESPKSTVTNTESRKQPDSGAICPDSDSKKNEVESEPVPPPSEEDQSVEEFASDQLYNSNMVPMEAVTTEHELDQLGVSKDDAIVLDDNELWDELKAELDHLDLDGTEEPEITWSEEELHSMLLTDEDAADKEKGN